MRHLAPILALFLLVIAAAESVAGDTPLPPINASGTSSGSASSKFDSEAALAASQQAIGNRIGEYQFMTPEGKMVSFADLRGKPLLLSLVYTSCFHTCPTTIQHLAKVVAKAKDALGEESFNVAVLGFDVDNDEPGAMRYFGRKQGINDEGWYLLSADRATIDALMPEVGFVYVPSPRGYDHLIQATLVDAEGVIYRQVYGEVFDTQLLVEPMMDLVLNRPTKGQPFLDDLVNRVRFFCTTYDPRNDAYRFDYSLFLGMLIGASIILSAIWFMISETRKRNRLRRRS
jgi:protein SCO1/2